MDSFPEGVLHFMSSLVEMHDGDDARVGAMQAGT